MILSAALAAPLHEESLLAVIDIESDTLENWGDGIRRKIHGTVRSRGPIWDDFMRVWTVMALRPFEEDGRTYVHVNGLVVDNDRYGNFAGLSLSPDGRTIGLLLVESHFNGDLDEYRRWLAERNQRNQWYLDKLASGVVSRNDVRQWEGLERMDGPFFDLPMSAEDVLQLRSLVDKQIIDRRNTIV
jgi:hypothetical protein